MKGTATITIITVILTAATFQLASYNLVDTSWIQQNHFNIITANAVFAGFFFTCIAILLGFSDKRFMLLLEKTNQLENIYQRMINGVVLNTISIAIALFNGLFSSAIVLWLNPYDYGMIYLNSINAAEISVLIVAIVIFFVSLLVVTKIIRKVRDEIRSKITTVDDVKGLFDPYKTKKE